MMWYALTLFSRKGKFQKAILSWDESRRWISQRKSINFFEIPTFATVDKSARGLDKLWIRSKVMWFVQSNQIFAIDS